MVVLRRLPWEYSSFIIHFGIDKSCSNIIHREFKSIKFRVGLTFRTTKSHITSGPMNKNVNLIHFQTRSDTPKKNLLQCRRSNSKETKELPITIRLITIIPNIPYSLCKFGVHFNCDLSYSFPWCNWTSFEYIWNFFLASLAELIGLFSRHYDEKQKLNYAKDPENRVSAMSNDKKVRDSLQTV